MLQRLFSPRPAVLAGRRLYASAAVQARDPAFYQGGGVPDTPEGRFELYSLHVVLILHRLKEQGSQAAETAQAVYEAYRLNLDDALRELGVGDLSVGKKLRKLFEAFYGRIRSYDAALGPPVDRPALEALIARTVLAGVEGAAPAPLADYVTRNVEALSAAPLATVLGGEASWQGFQA